MNRPDFLGSITDQIIEKLNNGVLPWRKSWKSGVPSNFISKHPYNGINFLTLLLNDLPSPYYLTFLQCKEKGGMIKKGAKGYPVIYWKINEYCTINAETDEMINKTYPFIRFSYVFNLSETNLYNENEAPKIEECESIIAGMKIKPVIKHNISKCYYNPVEDYISIPRIEDFESREEYYSSLFHEIIHWTGHPSRLNRSTGRYGTKEYAYEELIAEIGSAYLCSLCGIANKIIDNQTSYIQGWIRLMKENPRIIMEASKEAGRAVEIVTVFINEMLCV